MSKILGKVLGTSFDKKDHNSDDVALAEIQYHYTEYLSCLDEVLGKLPDEIVRRMPTLSDNLPHDDDDNVDMVAGNDEEDLTIDWSDDFEISNASSSTFDIPHFIKATSFLEKRLKNAIRVSETKKSFMEKEMGGSLTDRLTGMKKLEAELETIELIQTAVPILEELFAEFSFLQQEQPLSPSTSPGKPPTSNVVRLAKCSDLLDHPSLQKMPFLVELHRKLSAIKRDQSFALESKWRNAILSQLNDDHTELIVRVDREIFDQTLGKFSSAHNLDTFVCTCWEQFAQVLATNYAQFCDGLTSKSFEVRGKSCQAYGTTASSFTFSRHARGKKSKKEKSSAAPKTDAVQSSCTALSTCIDFLVATMETIFRGHSQTKNLLGDLFHELISTLVSSVFKKFTPDTCIKDLCEFKRRNLAVILALRDKECLLERSKDILADFFSGMTTTFCENLQADVLDKARGCIREELTATKLIERETFVQSKNVKNPDDIFSVDYSEAPGIWSNGYINPLCFGSPFYISRGTHRLCHEILDPLVEQILDFEPGGADEGVVDVQAELTDTVSLVGQLYLVVCVQLHRKHLPSSAKHCALHLTNCTYMARHLVSIATKLHRVNCVVSGVSGLVSSLHDLAFEPMHTRVQIAQTEILTIVRKMSQLMGSDGEDKPRELAANETNSAKKAERHSHFLVSEIQRCIVGQVSTCFVPILPWPLASSLVAQLCDFTFLEMIRFTLSYEDVSETDCRILSSFFVAIISDLEACALDDRQQPAASSKDLPKANPQAPTILRMKSEQLARLEKLVFILNASLRQIAQEWSSGHGPLSMFFKPSHVRRLVQAIFQNTDQRAKLLASLKTPPSSPKPVPSSRKS